MRNLQGILVIVIFTLIFSFLGFSQSAWKKLEGKTIVDIKFKGLVNTNKDLVIGVLTLTKGDKFNYKTLRSNFKSLNALGFFKNIAVKTAKKNNKVIITFIFNEFPRVGAIAIEGEDEVDEQDIISLMILKPGNIYKDSDIIIDEKNIIELYKILGFDSTIVQLRARKGANNKLVNIIVQIQEGEAVFIESIKIIGTKRLDPDDIYDIIETRETNPFRAGQPLDRKKLRLDQIKIEQYMKSNGYWLGKVKSVKIKKDFLEPEDLDDREKGYFVLIEIDEGQQFRMGKIYITGHTVFKDKDLYPNFTTKEGEIYNHSVFTKDMAKIKEMYLNRGYIQLQIIPTPRIDEKNLILSWDIELIEGEKVHIERIRIMGHEKTKIWVIDREIRIFEGEIFNLKKIKKSVNRLQNTQYFSRVEPSPQPGSDDGLVELQFKMTEQRTGLVTVGAGFGTLTGFSVFEEVTEKNLFGTGWSLRERVEVGERRLNVEVGTSTRWLLPYLPVSFSFTFRYLRDTIDAYYSLTSPSSSLEQTYKLEAFEVDFTFGKALTDEWFIYTGYLISFSKATDPTNFDWSTDIDSSTVRGDSLYRDLYSGLIEDKFLVKISNRFGVSYDTRDLTLNTREGVRIRGIATYTGGFYGGDSQWLKWKNDYAYYINPVWDLVFASFFNYEILFNQFDGTFVIRDIDRLRFDGLNELRGWRRFGRDEIVGQGGKISIQQEIRFPLFEEILWSVLFADAGDVTDTHGSLPNSIHYYSFGFGFRVQIPLIPIRLYFAKLGDYNISQADTFVLRNGIEVVFSVGGFF